MSSKKILLSGVKPTGRPHLGNYFGAMRQFVELEDKYETYIMLADYHALTTLHNPKEIRENSLGVVLDYLAIGVAPEKVTIFKQSEVPEHTELAWIFDCITTMPYLMRAHAFKDAEAKNKEISVGTFNYPMLMAADILLYDADVVPVGADQKQHVEIARDTAEKFNRLFGETFKLPEPMILSEVAIVPGIDGQKMSKSYNNIIPLFGTDEEIRSQVMKIVTDSKGEKEPKDPGKDNIFTLHKLVSGNHLPVLEKRYREGGIGYKESKEILAENVIKLIAPMRERRKEFERKPEKIQEILAQGGEKARAVASAKIKLVRERIGVL